MSKFLNRNSEGWYCARDTMFNRMVSDLQVTKQKFKQAKVLRAVYHEDTISEGKLQEYEIAAIRDEWTGLYNSRFFARKLIREVRRSKRYKRPFSLLLVAVDKLPQLQELHGEMISQDILTAVANIIKVSVRNVDIAARLSFDRFAIILPETDSSRSRIVGQRIREKVCDSPARDELNSTIVTASIAIVSFPTNARDENQLLTMAVQFLETAQKQGGNQVFTS